MLKKYKFYDFEKCPEIDDFLFTSDLAEDFEKKKKEIKMQVKNKLMDCLSVDLYISFNINIPLLMEVVKYCAKHEIMLDIYYSDTNGNYNICQEIF